MYSTPQACIYIYIYLYLYLYLFIFIFIYIYIYIFIYLFIYLFPPKKCIVHSIGYSAEEIGVSQGETRGGLLASTLHQEVGLRAQSFRA